MALVGLFGVLALWAGGQGRWAILLLAIICYFD
jgi:hypothetical protein